MVGQTSHEPEDLVQEGLCGLVRALRTYDPGHDGGARFATYAWQWVKHAVMRAMTTTGVLVRSPEHVHEARRRVSRGKTDDYRGKEYSEADLQRAAAAWSPHESLSACDGDDWQPSGEGEVVGGAHSERGATSDHSRGAGESWAGAEDDQDRTAMVERVLSAVRCLPERERLVVELHLGLGGRRPMTLEEVGAAVVLLKGTGRRGAKRTKSGGVGVSRERVRQLQVSALRRLRRMLGGPDSA